MTEGGSASTVCVMPRTSCRYPDTCIAQGRGGPCRRCDAEAIARRAVLLRARIAANLAEGRPPYANRSSARPGQDRVADGSSE
jgi:hypothetical protein